MPLIPLRDGQHLHVRVLGRGKPVVLLHGFASSSAHWLPNVLPLAHRYRFILPDLRGLGRSHHVPFSHDDVLTNYADDLEDILNHLNLDKVILGGISMGAYTGLKFNQLGRFDRVERYLNIDQAPCVRNDDGAAHGLFGTLQDEVFPRFRALQAAAEAAGLDTPYAELPPSLRQEMTRTFGDFFAIALSRPSQQWLIRRLFTHAEPLVTRTLLPVRHWARYIQVMRAYVELDNDTRPHLARIQTPMTIMVGMRSAMYPPAGQLVMGEHVPHARIVRFERSGHVPMFDEPLKFQREFSRFLAGR